MCVNEVVGTLAGAHPNDHVNFGQSTNDVFPTAMRISALFLLAELFPVLDELVNALNEKAEEFDNVIKSGRTHLQDAAPIRFGQEFSGYAEAVSKSEVNIKKASDALKELGIGGTAVGTGLNTHPDYPKRIIKELQKITNLDVSGALNYFEAMQNNFT